MARTNYRIAENVATGKSTGATLAYASAHFSPEAPFLRRKWRILCAAVFLCSVAGYVDLSKTAQP
jgi:hypothetical protein